MRVLAEWHDDRWPPLLNLSIFGAPHRRQLPEDIAVYREVLREAITRAGAKLPIQGPVDMSLIFVDPVSPDWDNLIGMLFRAMDGGNIVVDDRNVQKMVLQKIFHEYGKSAPIQIADRPMIRLSRSSDGLERTPPKGEAASSSLAGTTRRSRVRG